MLSLWSSRPEVQCLGMLCGLTSDPHSQRSYPSTPALQAMDCYKYLSQGCSREEVGSDVRSQTPGLCSAILLKPDAQRYVMITVLSFGLAVPLVVGCLLVFTLSERRDKFP